MPTSRARGKGFLSVSSQVRNPTWQPTRAGPARVAYVNVGLQDQGVSDHARRLIEASLRPYTQSVYASFWRKWLLGAIGTSSILLRLQNLTLLSIDYLDTIWLCLPSSSVLVNHLIRGAVALRARVPTLVPRWDIIWS